MQIEEPAQKSKYKKFMPIILIILIVGAIGAGLVLRPVISKNSSSASQAEASSAANAPVKLNLYQAQVAISSRGIYPQTVTVKKGDAVAWINKDRSLHLIVSDTGTPAFKGQGALMFSDMYLVTFNVTGTYTYYDQLNPTFKGTVIVQ